jgi:hypothetical protein
MNTPGTNLGSSTYRLPSAIAATFLVLAGIGGVSLAAGLFNAPERTFVQVLLLSFYLVGVALGGLLIVALHYVTGARWSNAIRRVPEAVTAILPVGALGILAVLVLRPSIYSWTQPAAAEDYVSPLQHFWLHRPFFLIRALIYIGIWLAFAFAMVRASRRQDEQLDSTATQQNVRLSAAFLVVFGITFWLASNNWIMSLEPQWASTIFAVYNFAGVFLSGLAVAVILVAWLRPRSALKAALTTDQLHDLGTLLFSFSSFWMYCWFCQYMLIWYVNNPEETAYYRVRWQEPWPRFMFLSLILSWAIPFVVLLFRGAKRNPGILSLMALLILAGRWLDLYVMIAPTQQGVTPSLGPIEAGLAGGAVGLFGLAFFRSLGKAALVPLHESPALPKAPGGSLQIAGHG